MCLDSLPTRRKSVLVLRAIRDDDKAFATLALELHSTRAQLGHKITAVTPGLIAHDIIGIIAIHASPPPEIENDY
jgi:hypothetical protein